MGRHGHRCTGRSTTARLIPRIAADGFSNRLYLPPIHPIGKVHRKGRNNTVTAEPGDVGSPWAIGSDEGGHDAVHPTWAPSPTSTSSSPGARQRPGGGTGPGAAVRPGPSVGRSTTGSGSPSCRTAPSPTPENPPKKYQDIYPLNFDNDPAGLCTTRCCGWSGTGSTTASRSSGSTTRTPSRRFVNLGPADQ